MKKIGILTIHRIYNHGSFLQSFASKSIVEGLFKNEVKCEFIDWPLLNEPTEYEYKVPAPSATRPKGIKFWLHKTLGHSTYCSDVEIRWNYKKLAEIYTHACQKYLNVTPRSNHSFDYDFILVGSDEVFNCTQDDAKWDTTYCFQIEKKRMASYAGSFGYSTLNRLKQYKLDNIVKDGLLRFDNISVRDRNSFEIVEGICGRKPYIHLDPVLIFNYDKYIPKINIKYSFILVYNYINRINDPNYIKSIKQFARTNKLKIVSVFEYCYWADKNIVLEPFEVLAYFKLANYVITDTFHGAILSLKFNKNFLVFVQDSNKNKLYYLLDRFKLTNHIPSSPNEIENILKYEENWTEFNIEIEKERNRSIEYFKSIIKNI